MVKLFYQVKPKGLSGNKVIVEYVDTETKQFLETEMASDHEVPSREFIPKKHGSLQETIKKLEKEYPEVNFSVNRYGGGKTFPEKEIVFAEDKIYFLTNNDFQLLENIDENNSYIIRARMKDRALRKKLDFTFGPKKNPLFITNTEKSALARSIVFKDEEEAKLAYNNYVTVLSSFIPEEDISLKKKDDGHIIEIRTENKNMKFLDLNEFRLQRYESEQIQNAKDLERLIKELENFPFPRKVDKFTVVETLDKRKVKQYKILMSATDEVEVQQELKKYNILKISTQTGKPALLPRQALQDPFTLNSPTNQLRNKFPIFTVFDSEKELVQQINMRKNPIMFDSIEKKLEEIHSVFMENCCSIDLEVIDYNNNIPSGRIYMAVLDSKNEKKLYVSKEAWRNESWKEKAIQRFSEKNIEFVFVENEVELVMRLNQDSQKYRFILGHNILDYDLEHLTKFDKEKNSNSTNDLHDFKIKHGIKKSQRIWSRTAQEILDTYCYSKNRITLLGDSKLSTLAGFKKSLSYQEINDKIKSGKFENFIEVCNYTLEDGEKSSEATNLLLRNSILEAMLVNKPLNTVFNTDPVMLHYEAGDRNYEIMTGTYSKRHEQNFKRFMERLKNRKTITETTNSLFKYSDYKPGKIQGILQYPTIILDVFGETIENNAVAKYIFESSKKETNLLIKESLLSILEYHLQIPVDKARTYMEAKNLRFGENYDLDKIYNFWKFSSEDAQKIFKQKPSYNSSQLTGLKLEENIIDFLSDEEFNQANIIFSMQYGAKFYFIKSPHGINLNVIIPEKSKQLKEKLKEINKANPAIRANTFIISENNPVSEAINFGKVNAVAYKDWFAGVIFADREYEIYQNIQKPKIPLIKQAFKSFFEGKILGIDDFRQQYTKLSETEKRKITEKQRTALKIMYDADPFQTEPDLFSSMGF